MERYLDGQELSPEEVASALKAAVTRGELFPVACGVATKNLGTTAVLDLLVEGVPSPAKKGAPIEIEGAGSAAFVFKTVADPVRGPHQHLPRSPGLDLVRRDARQRAHARQGARRRAARAPGQGARVGRRVRRGRHRRGRQAQGRDDRRPAARLGPEGRAAEPRLPRAGDELRDHAQGEGRRGEGRDVAAPAERGGPDAAAPPRPSDRRAAPLGHDPDARRGRGRPAQAPLRRRGRPPPAARAVPGDDPQGSRRATAATRSRPAAAASSATATIVLEPIEGHTGYEFVDKIVGGVIPQSFRPAVDKGIQEAMLQGRARRRARAGGARAARRRLVPHRRLLGDGVQDRRLDGVQAGVRAGRPGAARADHGGRRHGARRDGRRGERRPQLTPRAGSRGWSRAAA